MTQIDTELDENLRIIFDRLREVPSLDPQVAEQERILFLAKGEQYHTAALRQLKHRPYHWFQRSFYALQKQDYLPRFSSLVVLILFIILLFGGGGIVFAAQSTLPDELLYPIKTWSEDIRFVLAVSPQKQLDLTLDYSNLRVNEITNLINNGKPLLAGVFARLEEELDKALTISSGMEDANILHALEQIRLAAQVQLQAISNLAADGPQESKNFLYQLQVRLEEQMQMAGFGLGDPQGFRLQVNTRFRNSIDIPSHTPKLPEPSELPVEPTATMQPTEECGNPGPGGCQTPTSTEPYQYGPSHTSNPAGDGYGQGEGTKQPTPSPHATNLGPQRTKTPQARKTSEKP